MIHLRNLELNKEECFYPCDLDTLTTQLDGVINWKFQLK